MTARDSDDPDDADRDVDDEDPLNPEDAENPIEPLEDEDGDAVDEPRDNTGAGGRATDSDGESSAASPIEPLDAETGADKERPTVGDDNDRDMASSREDADDNTPPDPDVEEDDAEQRVRADIRDDPTEPTPIGEEPADRRQREMRDEGATSGRRRDALEDREVHDEPRDDRETRDRRRRDVRESREDRRQRRRDDRADRRRDTREDREPPRDPLDVTEADLDTTEVDEEDLDRLAELLDEARDDPDTVGGRDLEDMLTVFDDAGIDTSNLDVDDLEERFDESLKVARMLVTAAANTSEYAGLAGLRAGSRMAEAAFTSESPRDLFEETTIIARDELGRLGLPLGGDERTDGRTTDRGDRQSDDEERQGPIRISDLRRRGKRLLDLSADVNHEETFHPAYVRVIEQLSTDEARILRLLATEGPQPALDVYDRGLLPLGEGTPVADGLTMLDIDAGLRYQERLDVYIDNLERLGLLELGENPLRNLEQYRVLQAQPTVERAEERARRPRAKRRSVRLTAMGVDFCRTVFPFEVADRYDEDTPPAGAE